MSCNATSSIRSTSNHTRTWVVVFGGGGRGKAETGKQTRRRALSLPLALSLHSRALHLHAPAESRRGEIGANAAGQKCKSPCAVPYIDLLHVGVAAALRLHRWLAGLLTTPLRRREQVDDVV